MKYTLKNKEIELTDEEVKEIVKQSSEPSKEEEKKLEIKSRGTGEIIYSSEKTTYKEVVEEAVLSGANLGGANLGGANLRGSNLYGANLSEAELQNAKFYGKGGDTKIKKNQVDDFLKALGIIVV